jgi:hypothetical protein
MKDTPLRQLWDEHDRAPYPEGLAGEEVGGVEVTTLDTHTAGCIHTYLFSGRYGRRLDHARLQFLRGCHADLERVVPLLDGEARDYLDRLRRISALALAEMDGVQPA